MKTLKHLIVLILVISLSNCEDGIRDITGGISKEITIPIPTPVVPTNINSENDILIAYPSKEPLTNSNGLFSTDSSAFNSVLHFPTLIEGEEEFFYSYLHPSDYYITVIADKDEGFGSSLVDLSSVSTLVSIGIEENKTTSITNVNVQN